MHGSGIQGVNVRTNPFTIGHIQKMSAPCSYKFELFWFYFPKKKCFFQRTQWLFHWIDLALAIPVLFWLVAFLNSWWEAGVNILTRWLALIIKGKSELLPYDSSEWTIYREFRRFSWMSFSSPIAVIQVSRKWQQPNQKAKQLSIWTIQEWRLGHPTW